MDKSWIQENDQLLFQSVLLHQGKNWKKIAQGVIGKTEHE